MTTSGLPSLAASIQRHFKLGELRSTNERTLIVIENRITLRTRKGFARVVELEVESAIPRVSLWDASTNPVLFNSTVEYMVADVLSTPKAILNTYKTYRAVERSVYDANRALHRTVRRSLL